MIAVQAAAKRAAARTRQQQFVLTEWPEPTGWLQSQFHIPETRAALELQPYQQAVVKRIFKRDVNDQYPYSVVVWSDVKKSAKSTIVAALVDYVASHTPLGSIKIVANDLKQADSRVAYYLRRSHLLSKRPDVRMKNYIVDYQNGTRVEAIPIDPKGEAGGTDDLIVFSELWAANQKAALSMWTEMTLSPTKYGRSFRLIETYAGHSGESPLLENLYEIGVKQGRNIGAELDFPDLEVYENQAARMLCLWNTTPRCPWHTDDYYAQEAAMLTPSEFQRVHRNQWVSSENVFVPAEWWDACRVDNPPFDRSKGILIGMDAAVSNDSFGVVAVQRTSMDSVSVVYAREWKPPKGGTIDFAEVETEVRRLCREYNVSEVCYDEYQLHSLCQRLMAEGVAYCRPFPQTHDRLVADKNLYDVIRERRIAHNGDPALAEHVRNANQKAEGENKLRIVKRAEHLKIDLVVATSMCVSEAFRLNF